MFKIFFPNISVHGDQNHDSGLIEFLEQFVAFISSVSTKSADEIIVELLPGISSMANIHPLFVHFPIAFFTFFFIIDICGSLFSLQNWRKFAGWLLYIGTAMAAATVVAGLNAAHSIEHNDEIHLIMEQHEHLAFSGLILATLLSIWRIFSKSDIKGFANLIHCSLSVILFTLLFFTADLGGYMVYQHGVAVQAENTEVDADLLDYLKNQPHEHNASPAQHDSHDSHKNHDDHPHDHEHGHEHHAH